MFNKKFMEENKKEDIVNSTQDDKSYYDKNKEKIRLQQRIYYQNHKKKLNEAAKKHYSNNKEFILENNKVSLRKKNYDKQYYLVNKAKIQQRRKYLYEQTKMRKKIKNEIRKIS
jgi:hypothetical protein